MMTAGCLLLESPGARAVHLAGLNLYAHCKFTSSCPTASRFAHMRHLLLIFSPSIDLAPNWPMASGPLHAVYLPLCDCSSQGFNLGLFITCLDSSGPVESTQMCLPPRNPFYPLPLLSELSMRAFFSKIVPWVPGGDETKGAVDRLVSRSSNTDKSSAAVVGCPTKCLKQQSTSCRPSARCMANWD